MAFQTLFRDRRQKIDEDESFSSYGFDDAGSCTGNSDGADRKRHRRTNRALPGKVSGIEGFRRTRRDRRRVRVGVHHAVRHHSAKSHLRHAARQPRISQRLGHGRRSIGHRRWQPHFVVDLSRKRAPVDQIAWRPAFSKHHAERTRTGGNVICLPVNLLDYSETVCACCPVRCSCSRRRALTCQFRDAPRA